MSKNLGSPDGGVKAKVVFFGSMEGLSGLAILLLLQFFCSIVLPVLVSFRD
jgi:hypothetical protein